jgi:RNA polymerase sigma-70 factor (ECF subfamily)
MAESLSDARLLERFVSDREEAAFVALIERHGPRVQRICRRILRNEHDVEDVFQATFLVLARKAAGIAWHDSVGPWIDGVARRLALHARSGSARKAVREVNVSTFCGGPWDDTGRLHERYHPRVVESFDDVESRDLRRVLDDELLRLPEKYRAPVVLCDLEGHTREEAARQLGWPAGSMSRRLDRGRDLLRCRLSHRGVALAVIGVATIAVAAAAMGLKSPRSQSATAIRQAMLPFRPESEGGRGHGAVLAAAREEGRPPDFGRILDAAREAAAAAGRLERLDPGRSASLWRRLTADMKRSALEVETACRQSDAPTLVAAARRLDRSCVACHAVFHQRPQPAASSSSSRPRFAPPGPARAGQDAPSRRAATDDNGRKDLRRPPLSAGMLVVRMTLNVFARSALDSVVPPRAVRPAGGRPLAASKGWTSAGVQGDESPRADRATEPVDASGSWDRPNGLASRISDRRPVQRDATRTRSLT